MDIVYIKLEPKIQLSKEKVSVSDVAEIVCRNETKKEQVKALCIHTFGIAERDVVTSLYIVNEIERHIKDIVVVPLGAEDVILERAPKKKPSGILEIGKVIFVSMVCFFGTGFTIMAFHNDIGIRGVFEGFVADYSKILNSWNAILLKILKIKFYKGNTDYINDLIQQIISLNNKEIEFYTSIITLI